MTFYKSEANFTLLGKTQTAKSWWRCMVLTFFLPWRYKAGWFIRGKWLLSAKERHYFCKKKSMDTLIVSPKTPEDLKILTDLLNRLGIAVLRLNEEEKEDLGLAILMQEANREEKATRDEVMKKLRRA